jgi:MFS family permease
MPDNNGHSLSALSSRNFRIYICGNSISVIGLWIQRLALGWQAWQLSESALVVGMVAGAQFIPMFLLTPFFGVIVDRISSRNGAIVMHAIMTIITASLAALTLLDVISIEWLLSIPLFSTLHGLSARESQAASWPCMASALLMPSTPSRTCRSSRPSCTSSP